MNLEMATRPDSIIDTVFKRALEEYQAQLLTTCADVIQRKEPISLQYETMTSGFLKVLNKTVQEKQLQEQFPSEMGSNLFGALIQEYLKNKEVLIKRIQRKNKKPIRKKRNRAAQTIDFNGHLYATQSFNINTYCEYCNSYIFEKGLVCNVCNFTCHQKCHTKYDKHCSGRRPSVTGPSALFGTDLSELTSENNVIPQAILLFMQQIKQDGKSVEGLYRKPGLQASINNLKSVLTSMDAEELLLKDENPHVLASTLKLFFRQLPKPLVSEETYEDFVRSTEWKMTKIYTIHSILSYLGFQLPIEHSVRE